MAKKDEILKLIKDKIVVLDGATGTELQKKGMPAGVCPEIWACENSSVQKSIYKSYSDAGSDIIYTCTFGANPHKLSQYGRDDVEKLNETLAIMAKEAAGKNTLVAGDIGPCGGFIEPFGDISFDAAVEAVKRQVRGLLAGGVDLFVIETQMDIQEARAALIAVKELTDAFTLVTMTYEKDGRTLNGTSPEAALITLQSLGADAVGCNCSTGPEEMLQMIKRITPLAKIPLAAKPNAGMPKIENGKTVFPMKPEEFASFAYAFAEAGTSLIGGCCGTTPNHIKLLADEISIVNKNRSGKKDINSDTIPPVLSSAREALIMDRSTGIKIIGERINPTGKKKLQAELLEGKLSIVREMASQQERAGAELLDINAGMPGIDEKTVSLNIINLLSPRSPLPLVIDSSSPHVVEAALRKYPGRALINSISGEKEKIEKLLPVAAKYGAMFILLPITDSELPEKADRRAEIAQAIYEKAKNYGFTKKDIIIDGLAMTVSSSPLAPIETLKTIEWASKNGFSSVIGLSNISFGLPQRAAVNSAFLSMAIAVGLSHVIANPDDTQIMWSKHAANLLAGNDKDASAYLKFAQQTTCITSSPAVTTKSSDPEDAIKNGIITGIREDIEPLIKTALEQNKKPTELLEKIMIPAILLVGDLYESKKYFLPQLLASAETMKKGFGLLQPLLEGESAESKGKILFATVEGDIHDIGKNIVSLMLKNYGFNVLDMGKDIPAETIIKEAKEFDPDIIALSALMTTTMVKMPEVIALAEKEKLRAKFMVGGAVVTRDWASSIGANYSKNGVEAVRVAAELIKTVTIK